MLARFLKTGLLVLVSVVVSSSTFAEQSNGKKDILAAQEFAADYLADEEIAFG